MFAMHDPVNLDSLVSDIIKVSDLSDDPNRSDELLASMFEELGELARAIKIKIGAPGTAHKRLDEAVECEVVDFFICVVAYHRIKHVSVLIRDLDVFDLLHSIYTDFQAPDALAQHCVQLYIAVGGDWYEFENIAHRKLAKWQSNLTPSV